MALLYTVRKKSFYSLWRHSCFGFKYSGKIGEVIVTDHACSLRY